MISGEDIKKLASLARIQLTADEQEKLAQDMENILGYVNQIQEVSAGSISGEKEKNRNVFRDDSNPHESGIYTERILQEAPQREGQYVRVKKIL